MKIQVLDCTLRDGGYVNGWNFGYAQIKNTISNLQSANIDVIECGFIQDDPYDPNTSVFDTIENMSKAIGATRTGTKHVGMIALGDADVNNVSDRSKGCVDGIRLSFHKGDLDEEIESAKVLIKKGYDLFVQPVGTTMYSDRELIDLTEAVNEISPFAFYIVDTLGMLYPRDLHRIFSIIDNNLDEKTKIGLHSHNNLQLSFSSAQELINIESAREILLDSSVKGMGRGAGNLPTELICQYINANIGHRYDMVPILKILDTCLNKIYEEEPWGYSYPYYLSATYGCHPNYASYLIDRGTLNVEDINKILISIPINERGMFNKELIGNLYLEFQSSKIDDKASISMLNDIIPKDNILLLAPGNSISSSSIDEFISKRNPYTISINGASNNRKIDSTFFSNSRRYAENRETCKSTYLITTSNIPKDASEKNIQINYSDYLSNSNEFDDAGLMLLNLLSSLDVKEVYLAGFDGYPATFNGANKNYSSYSEYNACMQKNDAFSNAVNTLSHKMKITFITPTSYRRDFTQ